MYVKSKYNIEIQKNDEYTLVYNTLTTAIIYVPNGYMELDNFEESEDELCEILIEQGIFIKSDRNEFREIEEYFYENKNMRMNYLNITIAPTYLCNMKCPYCFQEEKEKIMDTCMADKICESIILLSEGYKQININWFGGEPLLAIDIIEYISKKILAYCDSNKVGYTSGIVTNGTLLNHNTTEKLQECRISQIQVTLDGKNHDEIRKMKNGGKSYAVIKENIIDSIDKFVYIVRSNVTNENECSIEEMISDLMSNERLRGNIIFSFYPVSSFEEKSNKDCGYCQFCSSSQFGKLLIKLSEKVLHYESIDKIANFKFKSTITPCDAVIRETASFDAYGDVYKCSLSMQNDEMKIGNLYEDDIITIVDGKRNKAWMDFDWDDECKQCIFLPMCQSGCIYRIKASNNKHICCNEKEYIKELVKFYFDSKCVEN